MGEHLPMEAFDRNARDALADGTLREALRRATGLFTERRRAATGAVDDWQGLRTRARAIKDRVLADLDGYLVEFSTRLERLGVHVHWARDAAEACDAVIGIARDAGATSVVKSKSMTTEEIRLNEALEAAGIEPIETDFGEWIVQLAGEVPSHIIVPAIHKTRAQIAELLHAKVGSARDGQPAELAADARRILRDRFATAEVGVSGVNFGVAATGTLLILENEGNVRFTTSLPRVHVAVMGIEKLVPTIADLDPFLALLPRSGTGQTLTSYQTLITGPKRDASDDGPDSLHVVLLDNGRSRMLAHDVTRQALACIRCGACLNACPVYQQVGGHAYGSVYPGPIGAVVTPQLAGVAKARQLPFASSLCGACRDVCPVEIDIPALLLHLRAEVVERSARLGPATGARFPARRAERLAFALWAWAMRGPRRYAWAHRALRIASAVLLRDGRPGRLGRLVARALGPLGAWTKERDLRPMARESFRDWWAREEGAPR